MLMIRYQRIGRRNDPAFRIVVLEKERAAKSGRIAEQVGTYNPRTKALTIKEDSIKKWLSQGAQPTGSIQNLLITKGIMTGKKINVLPKKTVKKAEVVEEAAAPKAAAPVAEAAPAEVAEVPAAEAETAA